MMINEKPDRATKKELRVQLPADYVVKLRMIKILRGVDMREVVRAALDSYFEKNRMTQEANSV